MHDIKIVRKNPDFFTKKLSERNAKIDLKNLLDLDKKNRELIQNKEKLSLSCCAFRYHWAHR